MVKFTKWFIWIGGTIIIGVDIYLAANGKPGDTISEVTGLDSYKHQTIGYLYGLLTGHLFWPLRGKEIPLKWVRIGIAWALLAGFIVWDVYDMMNVMPIITVAVCTPLGRLLWPQRMSDKSPIIMWRPGRDG